MRSAKAIVLVFFVRPISSGNMKVYNLGCEKWGSRIEWILSAQFHMVSAKRVFYSFSVTMYFFYH